MDLSKYNLDTRVADDDGLAIYVTLNVRFLVGVVSSGRWSVAVKRTNLVVDLRLQGVRHVLEVRILRLIVFHHDGILEADEIVDFRWLLVGAWAKVFGECRSVLRWLGKSAS